MTSDDNLRAAMLGLAISVALVVGVIAWLLRSRGVAWRARLGAAGAMAVAVLPGAALGPRPEPLPALGVARTPRGEYVSSASCESCHPSEYASWARTYHRTMTQPARASTIGVTIDAPFSLELDGESYTLRRRGEEIWAHLPETGDHRLLLSTGSHHYQGYWLEGLRGGELRMFPFVYVFETARWLPRRDVFLQPPDALNATVRWNSNCIQCHATAGRPGYEARTDRFDTEVAELGIACESCHGPGGEHVRRHENPIERYLAHAAGRADPSIVNPSRLPSDRASMICGQCHAYTYPGDEEDWWKRGYAQSFRPGQDLGVSRFLLTPGKLHTTGSPEIDADLESLFFPDGTVRVGGREYNGLVASACFERGDGARRLSCLSCHSMHESDPDDQLVKGREGDGGCVQCHEEERYAKEAHTHHRPGSLGSACLGCHMPKTTYALLKTIRSHRIDSPDVSAAAWSERPNACNLCHLDRRQSWAAAQLHDWYGQTPIPAPQDSASSFDSESLGAGAEWLLAGDAGERAIAAAALGSAEGHATTGTAWEAPLLARALDDPYAAVRIVAYRSLRTLPGFQDLAYDPIAPPALRSRAAETVLRRWEKSTGTQFDRRAADGLAGARNDRPMTLSE
jgi:predicted CXXCH cytochrome family protein